MISFAPDLIVEVTQVCDRACAGCYAPNVVTKSDGLELLRSNPELFLSPKNLESAVANLSKSLASIAIRGGEPSRHPELGQLLKIASRIGKTLLETHGRWLLGASCAPLLKEIQESNTTVKISFDKMHGATSEELRTMLSRLTENAIPYLVAITESSLADYENTKALCDFVPESAIIFQKKASHFEELVRPKLGVIGVNGQFKRFLTHQEGIFKGSLTA
jgi:hypothetical protein